ncbi:MAG: PcfK-like family protein [Tannerellaceae bacterium]
MKTTDHFKTVIEVYLTQRAEYDELFAMSFNNPNKNIDDCITYILNSVQRSGYNGFTDDEVFSMAIHYYDEADIEIGKPTDCKVVVNHTVELTDEERRQARLDAMKRIENETYAKLKQPKKATKPQESKPQPSLFEF